MTIQDSFEQKVENKPKQTDRSNKHVSEVKARLLGSEEPSVNDETRHL